MNYQTTFLELEPKEALQLQRQSSGPPEKTGNPEGAHLKKCFKCGKQKTIREFYVHKMMADGHLNKCISCAKKDVLEDRLKKLKDPTWVKKERERCREKTTRRRQLGLEKTYPRCNKKWEAINHHKKLAQQKANRAARKGIIQCKTSCEQCGATGVRLEKHHEDYSKPLDVKFLCTKCHGLTRRIDKD